MFCRFCGAKGQDGSVFCNQCGSRIASSATTTEANPVASDGTDAPTSYFETNPAAPVPNQKKPLLIGLIAVAVLAVIGFAISVGGSNQTVEEDYSYTAPVEEEPVIDYSWVPDGYDWHSDDFATKWVTNEGDWPCSDCNFWKLKIVPHYDCYSGVYAEINMLDSAETVVDWTNDSLPSLSAGQTGLLVFENYPFDDNIDSGQLTELTCHP